jgi:hypothetical protein
LITSAQSEQILLSDTITMRSEPSARDLLPGAQTGSEISRCLRRSLGGADPLIGFADRSI